MTSALETSLKTRLRNIAREKVIDSAELWQNLVLERFLVRIALSPYASKFILKGGMLLSKYVNIDRHTKDLDFSLRNLKNTPDQLQVALDEVLSAPVEDGFAFEDLKLTPLTHPHMKYPGIRAKIRAMFGKTRFMVSVDIGQGDLVEPTPISIPLTSGSKGALFESNVEIQCYPKEFIFAEKLEAILYLGSVNSRMKDFHDLFVMISDLDHDIPKLERVIRAVFEHRQTALELPIAFSESAMADFEKLWAAHRRTLASDNRLPETFSQVLAAINDWLQKATDLASG
jgi:predicted nucleotidyltransferase component of viral defense system